MIQKECRSGVYFSWHARWANASSLQPRRTAESQSANARVYISLAPSADISRAPPLLIHCQLAFLLRST